MNWIINTECAQKLGKRVRAVREAKGWTQLAFAALSGYSRVAVWQWETGRNSLSVLRFAHLCSELGVSPGAILELDDKEFKRYIKTLTPDYE